MSLQATRYFPETVADAETLVARIRDHGWSHGNNNPAVEPQRCRVAWHPAFSCGIFRRQSPEKMRQWATRYWNFFGGERPNVSDVTDSLIETYTLLREHRDEFLRTRLMLVCGTLVPQISTPLVTAHYQGMDVVLAWREPPIGIDVTPSLSQGGDELPGILSAHVNRHVEYLTPDIAAKCLALLDYRIGLRDEHEDIMTVIHHRRDFELNSRHGLLPAKFTKYLRDGAVTVGAAEANEVSDRIGAINRELRALGYQGPL